VIVPLLIIAAMYLHVRELEQIIVEKERASLRWEERARRAENASEQWQRQAQWCPPSRALTSSSDPRGFCEGEP
jgi:hypothetical protein